MNVIFNHQHDHVNHEHLYVYYAHDDFNAFHFFHDDDALHFPNEYDVFNHDFQDISSTYQMYVLRSRHQGDVTKQTLLSLVRTDPRNDDYCSH